MIKQIARLRIGLVLLLGVLLLYSSASAMEMRVREGNRRDNRRDGKGYDSGYNRDFNKGYIRGRNRGDRHYYRGGRWYKHDSMGREVTVTVLSIGAFIESLPPRYETVVVDKTPYYHDDRYYYRSHSDGGYVVVSAPARVQTQPQRDYDYRGERDSDRHTEDYRDHR